MLFLICHGRILDCDTLIFLARVRARARDQKEVQTTMKRYELCLVVSAKVDDEVRLATLEQVKEYITRFGGTIVDVDDWGKKKLAYEIQKMSEGYYYFIHFDAEPTVPGELEHRVRIMENVIRYLCVKQEA